MRGNRERPALLNAGHICHASKPYERRTFDQAADRHRLIEGAPLKGRASPRVSSSWSLYDHGFVRVAACTPRVRVADPGFNLAQIVELARRADRARCVLAVYPELCLLGYTNDDLFFQDALLARALEELARFDAS